MLHVCKMTVMNESKIHSKTVKLNPDNPKYSFVGTYFQVHTFFYKYFWIDRNSVKPVYYIYSIIDRPIKTTKNQSKK